MLHNLSACGCSTPPIYSKQSGRYTHPYAGIDLKIYSFVRGGGFGGYALGAKDLSIARCGTREYQRRPKPAVRIQANPTALSSYGIDMEDVRATLQQTNINLAKGNFDGPQQSYQIGSNDQLLSGKDYQPIIVAYHNGAPVTISNVATVINGVENVNQAAWMNDVPAVIVNIQRQPGANIIQVVDRIKKLYLS